MKSTNRRTIVIILLIVLVCVVYGVSVYVRKHNTKAVNQTPFKETLPKLKKENPDHAQ